MNTTETGDAIRTELEEPQARLAVKGPANERLVSSACVIRDNNRAGRTKQPSWSSDGQKTPESQRSVWKS